MITITPNATPIEGHGCNKPADDKARNHKTNAVQPVTRSPTGYVTDSPTGSPVRRNSPIKDEDSPGTKQWKHWKSLDMFSGMTSLQEEITVTSTFHGMKIGNGAHVQWESKEENNLIYESHLIYLFS
ncbi:histone acetyltransferase, MYST superfamily [Corchorus olitorius]|uniref:Histone acetyltransferase, MYST superfamily n=1 Tax=Corchorus olitorius TaxID=93759 RepID=A0A1R3KJT3_9ROSI|nr:histone acetyltransferase, MYST superfamily [Corchorus olitorius]